MRLIYSRNTIDKKADLIHTVAIHVIFFDHNVLRKLRIEQVDTLQMVATEVQLNDIRTHTLIIW